jgi:hypothetical protein
VKLGQRILNDLGLTNGVDTLSRWMAHRIAELIEQADQAYTPQERETARQECTELIIRLWERRWQRSNGRPFSEIISDLEQLTAPPPSQYGAEVSPSENTWIGAMSRLEQLAHRERRICYDAAVAGLDIDSEREWLIEHKDDLSEEEQKGLRLLVDDYERLKGEYYTLDGVRVPDFAALSSRERTRYALEALERVKAERQDLSARIQEYGGYQQDPELPVQGIER